MVVAVTEKYIPEIREQLATYNLKKIYYLTEKDFRELYKNTSDENIIRCRWLQRKPGMPLSLENPQSYNEKIQWMKLNDRRKEYTYLADKFYVKEWLKKQKIKDLNIIPTIGVWESVEEIQFKDLPNQFVLKATHDSGSIVLCNDKETFHKEAAWLKLANAMSVNYYWYDREWGYKGIIPKIIAEPYMVDESGYELKDYKFQCINGRVEIIQVDFGRFHEHKRNLYDREWNYIEAEIKYPSDREHQIPRPNNLENLIRIAEHLAQPFPYVRVDLYDINSEVYFGEFTFYHGGGYEEFRPYELDLELGSKIRLERN